MLSPKFVQFKHSGIVSDLPPEEVSAKIWTNGINIQFQDTATTRVGGYAPFADPLSGSGPIFAMNVVHADIVYWIYCTTNQVFVTDATNHWDITPTGGLVTCEPGDWTGTVLNGIPVLNNQVDAPIYWDLNASSPCEILPGWPIGARCKVIRSFKYHLFALNVFDVFEQPNTLWWSEGADPGALPQEWVPSPSNDAGDMVLADTPGEIIDGLGLRDTFVVYKDYSTYAISYVAGQYVYTNQKLFLTSGLQSANCIVEVNGEHWVFTGTDVIRHDGQTYQSIVQDKLKHQIIDSIEPTKTKLVCMVFRHRSQQVWLSIPTAGNNHLNKAYIINTLTGDIGIRELPDVAYITKGIISQSNPDYWDIDSDQWDFDSTFWNQQSYSPTEDTLLMCDQDSNHLFAVDISPLADGELIYAMAERLSLPTNDNIMHAFVTRVVPRVSGNTGDTLYITAGGQQFFDRPVQWGSPVPFVIGTDTFVDVQTEGRLFSIRFDGITHNIWQIHSYRIEIVDLGLY